MQLHDVHKGISRRKLRKRVGRGTGSGHGKTSSKGHKGHASRQGFKLNPIFEGGQMPLARRVPKRGFFNGAFKKEYAIVNLRDLARLDGDSFTVDRLVELGVVGKLGDGLKVLGTGQLTRKITVEAHHFSKSALDKIQKAGGTAQVIGAAAQ